MQRIEVKNFGPLKDITLDIKDYMVFIGPQASGKSTLAKLIYFFWEIKKEYKSTLPFTIAFNKFLKNDNDPLFKSLESKIRNLFEKRFPLFRTGNISFIYDVNYRIEIDIVLLTSNIKGDIKVSDGFISELKNFESRINDFLPVKKSSDINREISGESLLEIILDQLLNDGSYLFFNRKFTSIDTFIPAERILISILSNSIPFLKRIV